jgi:3-oxoacyl-[acyl-carrier-protein] synthase II
VAPIFMRQFMRLANDARYDLTQVSFRQQLRLVEAGQWLTPYMQIIDLAGHSVGQLGLQMDTVYGRTAVVADETVPHAPVTEYDPGDYVPRKKVRRMDPANTYAIAAAKLALAEAGLAQDSEFRENFGVIVGTGYSGFASVVEHQRAYLRDGIAQLTPIHFPNTVYNASAGMVAIELGLNGPNTTVTGLDVSGEFALAYAWMLLRQGMAQRVVVVGVDDLCPALLEGFHNLGFAARDTATPSEPMARQRRGFIPGEGAGALVLETASAAAERGAKVLGRIEGIGIWSSADAVFSYSDSTKPIELSSKAALEQAGCDWSAIDWVSSAANGTPGLDAAEAEAFSSMLDAERQAVVPFKRFTGEFSASGVMRVALGLGCLQRGSLPAALGDDPVESMRPFLARQGAGSGRRFLHHGLGLGGNSVSVVVAAEGVQHAAH